MKIQIIRKIWLRLNQNLGRQQEDLNEDGYNNVIIIMMEDVLKKLFTESSFSITENFDKKGCADDDTCENSCKKK